MHFSKLRLTGFKSFVDQTELVIQDGLTGIVGPNGCGKSNLLEAIRWVMGENRPTAMRGGGMVSTESFFEYLMDLSRLKFNELDCLKVS